MQPLIKGSAHSKSSQSPAFIVDKGANGFHVHFATRQLNNDNFKEQNWHFIDFREDWVKMVRTYKRLPYNDIEEPLKLEEENRQLKSKNQ